MEQIPKKDLKTILKKTKHIHGCNISKLNKKDMLKIITKHKLNGGFLNIGEIINNIKEKLFFPPNKLPKSTQIMFDKHKNDIVQNVTICRQPIHKAVKMLLNWLSLGSFGKESKKLGYDNFFHLFMVVKTDKSVLRIEKNERVTITYFKNYSSDTEVINVPIKTKKTLNDFLETAREKMGDRRFFQYNAFSNNCQDFILGILNSNGVSLESHISKFIKQDIKELVPKLPSYLSSISQFFTDTAGKASQIFSGQGKK